MRPSLALVVLLLLASPAMAEAPTLVPSPQPPADTLEIALHTWHQGERVAGFGPFLGAGLATVISGSLLVGGGTAAGRGAGWPLLTLGALEAIAGLFFGINSIGKEAERAAALQTDRAAFLVAERARVARITSRFQPVLLAVEALVTVGGGAAAGAGALTHNDTIIGIGAGLAVQGLILFLLDWAVLDRAQAYEAVLKLW